VKTVLVDASSAILLHKARVLLQVQAVFRLCVAAAVYEELTLKRRPGSRTVALDRRDGRIRVVRPQNHVNYPRLPTSLHRGERDTLRCYLDGGTDFIIIDDCRGAGYCRREALPYVNALLCPRLLAAAGRLSPTEARAAMFRIAHLGRYSEWVKHYAATCSDSALATFLP
jgi:predicted nucleic acid-binding protein